MERYHDATSQYVQATLRSVVGQVDLDELLSQREKLNKIIQQILDEATDPWGIKVTAIEIKDVILPVELRALLPDPQKIKVLTDSGKKKREEIKKPGRHFIDASDF